MRDSGESGTANSDKEIEDENKDSEELAEIRRAKCDLLPSVRY